MNHSECEKCIIQGWKFNNTGPSFKRYSDVSKASYGKRAAHCKILERQVMNNNLNE